MHSPPATARPPLLSPALQDRLPETPSIESWLSSAVPKGQAVGLDPFLFPIGTVQRMKDTLEKAGVQLDARAHGNLVDAAWGEEAGGKPAAPRTPVFVLDAAKYAGRTAEVRTWASERAGCAARAGGTPPPAFGQACRGAHSRRCCTQRPLASAPVVALPTAGEAR